MFSFLKISLFLFFLFCAAAAVAVSRLIAVSGWQAMGYYFIATLVFAGAGYFWYRSTPVVYAGRPSGRGWHYVATFLAATVGLYFLVYTVVSGVAATRVALFAHQYQISNYKELPIIWPGFKGPVGVRIEFDLLHPVQLVGQVHRPRILIGENATQPSTLSEQAYRDFCRTAVEQNTLCLLTPVWPIREPMVLQDADSTAMVFELYPSNITHMESSERLCLRERQPYVMEYAWEQVGGFMQFAAKDRVIDLNERFNTVLKQESKILLSPEKMQKLFIQLQEPDLLAAGYEACEIRTAILYSKESMCYCRVPKSATKAEK